MKIEVNFTKGLGIGCVLMWDSYRHELQFGIMLFLNLSITLTFRK